MNESNQRTADSSTMEPVNPISMLKEDHKNVKKLFDQFENADDKATQMDVARTAISELKVHAAIEEEIFYPAVKSMVDDEEIMSEAMEEHHVVHLLIDELEQGDLEPEVFHAKFMVLAENVRHHIREEEGEMMPKIAAQKSDLQETGERMARRKEELAENPDRINEASAGGSRQKMGSTEHSSTTSSTVKGANDNSSSSKSRTGKTRQPGAKGGKKAA